VQELLPANSVFKNVLRQVGRAGSTTVDVDACQHGAVIFGRNSSSRFAWSRLLPGDPSTVDSALAELKTDADAIDGDSSGDSLVQTLQSSCGHRDSSAHSSGVTTQLTATSDSQATQAKSPASSRSSLTTASTSGSEPGSPTQRIAPTSTTGDAVAPNGSSHAIPGDLQSTATPRKRPAMVLDDDDDDTHEGGIAKRLRHINLKGSLLHRFDKATGEHPRGP